MHFHQVTYSGFLKCEGKCSSQHQVGIVLENVIIYKIILLILIFILYYFILLLLLLFMIGSLLELNQLFFM